MADDTPSDERLLYEAFQQLADVMLPLKQELRERAHGLLGLFFDIGTPSADLSVGGAQRPAGHRSPPPTQIASREPPAPKDFLFRKQPNTEVERVACLAYYLTHYRSTSHFKTTDISKLNTEAAQRKFANAAASVSNATPGGFLATVSRGMRQLAAEGERYVEALPDRAAAKAAFGSRKPKRQRRKGGTGATTAPAQPQED